MGNSRRAPHSRAGLLPTQLNLSGRASRARWMVSGVFLFSNACRRCIPRGWALFLQPVFHSGHIGNAVPGGVPFFHALLFWNICSARLGGILQNAATALKLLPLLLIAVCGLFFGNPGETIGLSAKSPAAAGWISAIGPIAFAYDDGSSPPPSLMK